MRWLKNIGREVFGLFVDDGLFALAILLWLLVVWLLLRYVPDVSMFRGVVVYLGLAAILLGSVLRRARR